MNSDAESHRFLRLFTMMAVPAGILFIGAPLLFLREKVESGAFIFLAAAMAALGVALIVGSVHTLRVTNEFRNWNHGLSRRQKVIPWLILTIGGWMSLAFFFVIPFIWSFSKRE